MKKIWKIARIVFAFIASMFVISMIWYAVGPLTSSANEKPVPYIDYVLHLLGFRSLDIQNHYVLTGFSILGLFSVTLLSSIFTVSLFDLKSKILIGQEIFVTVKHIAKVHIIARKKDAYDLTVVLISKCGNEITSEKQSFPYLSKQSKQDVFFKVEPGTVIYKYLRTVLSRKNGCTYVPKESEDPKLILTIEYTDIESGQVYKMAYNYQYPSTKKMGHFVFCQIGSEENEEDIEQQVCEEINNNVFSLNLASIQTCNSDYINICPVQTEQETLQREIAFQADINMNNQGQTDPPDFTMAYTTDLFDHDWRKFYDLGCALKFDYRVAGGINAVTFEFKCGNNNIIKKTCKLYSYEDFHCCAFSLKEFVREELALVQQLCFTVFLKDMNGNKEGSFVIKNPILEAESRENESPNSPKTDSQQ